MTSKEIKPVLSSVRSWLVEIGSTLPLQFAEHVAIIAGELTRRIKAEEEASHADLDNRRLNQQ